MAQLKHVLKGPNEIVPFDHPTIEYPQLASTKYDGFRCLNLCGERLVSPALKPIPNRNLIVMLDQLLVHCSKHRIVTDGEIWSPELKFNDLQSIIRSFDEPIPSHVGYYIFDTMSESEWDNGTEKPFIQRYLDYKQTLAFFPSVHPVEQWHTTSAKEAEEFFNGQIELGHEGMILRQPNAKYKHGRCTLNQDGLWKFKEFQTKDAVIVGIEEQMKLKNGVERTRNELGELERRYEQDLYEPAGMVGAFLCEDENGIFKVKPGKGFDNLAKIRLWNKRVFLIGSHVEYKHMPHGSKDKPRIGSLVRFREDLD